MAKTATQEFLDRVLATVPEDKKADVQSMYSRAQDEQAAQQQTIEDATAQVRATAAKQTEWWNANKDAVTELAEIKKTGGGGLTEAAIGTRLDTLRDDVMSNGLALITTATTIAAGHLKEFGEPLDMRVLAQEAIKANKSLDQHYNESVAARRQERSTADLNARLEAAKAEGRKIGEEETRRTLGAQTMPFPGQATAPATTLSGLKRAPDGAAPPNVLDAAVATANEVIQRQSGT